MSKQLEMMLDAVRAAGYKITQPRRKILEVFATGGVHLSAPEVHEMIKEESPGVGLTTVYRTIELFTRLCILKVAYFSDGCMVYEPNWPNDHHHHLICSSCGQVEEFGRCRLKELEEEVAEITRYRVQGHIMQIIGQCPRCQVELRKARAGQ